VLCSVRVRRFRRGDHVRDGDAGGVPDPMGEVDVKPFLRVAASMPQDLRPKRERVLPERWWMAPIRGTLRPARRLAVDDEGHQER
jgi:hypothetical protein